MPEQETRLPLKSKPLFCKAPERKKTVLFDLLTSANAACYLEMTSFCVLCSYGVIS